MDKNQNRTAGSFFDFLADTLSISGLFTWSREKKPAVKPEKDVNPDKDTDGFFGFLADTLSISRVVA